MFSWKIGAACVSVMALMLGACSGGTSPASSIGAGEKPFDGEELNILLVQETATENLRDNYIPKFEEQTGIKVNLELLPESGMETRMLLALSQNTGEFDIVETGAKSWTQLVGSDWIIPLDKYVERDADYSGGFSPTLLKSLQRDGNTYAMPYIVGANMLFYNKEMFEAAGLDPAAPPNTMKDLIDSAKALNAPNENKSGVVFRGTREGNANSFSWIMMWFLNGGRWLDDAGEAKYAEALAEEPAIETARQYKELAQYAPRDIGNYSFTEAQVAMQQGEAAMWLDAAQLGPALEDPEQSTIGGKVGYHVMQGEGDDYVVGPVWAFSVTRSAENPDAAWELIKYLTSKDVALAQAVAGVNSSPARADVLEDPALAEKLPAEFLAALKVAHDHVNPHYSPLIPQGGEIRAALSLSLSEVLSGQKEPEAAMKEASDATGKILGG